MSEETTDKQKTIEWIKTFVAVLLIAIAAFAAGMNQKVKWVEKSMEDQCNNFIIENYMHVTDIESSLINNSQSGFKPISPSEFLENPNVAKNIT